MKNKLKILVASFLILTITFSCSNNSEDEDQSTERDYTSLSEIIEKHNEYEWKLVTIKAYCWGISNKIDGSSIMNLGSEKLTGLKQANIVLDLKGASKGLKEVKKDQIIVIETMVGKYENGAVILSSPVLLEVIDE